VATTPHFDGVTYDEALDFDRLSSALARVRWLLSHPVGRWWSLRDLAAAAGSSEAGVSARLRDLRKRRFGGLTVEARREDAGLWLYRLQPSED